MHGMHYLQTGPRCDFPEFVKILRHPETRDHRKGWTPAKKRPSDRRSTSDKTGQWSRRRQREQIIARWYGSLCHICLTRGFTDHRAVIDLTLPWTSPWSFSRDHVVPRSHGGSDEIENLRPAHRSCNEYRGNSPIRTGEDQ